MPRWWPKTLRVENVQGKGERSSWTQVLGTKGGRGLRADFRCTGSTQPTRFAIEQEIEGTPFERILKASTIEILLSAEEGGGTEVELAQDQRLKGVQRLGSPSMRRATRRILDEALEGLEQAVSAEQQ